MADFNKIEKKMEEERHKEETKYEEHNLVTSHSPLSPHEPHTWLMITDGKNGCGRHMFYGITEGHDYVRYVQELQNKKVSCCYGGWLIMRDKSKDRDKYEDYYSMLNILTMEKLQLPPLPFTTLCIDFVMSSLIMDRSCRVIFIERELYSFWSWQLGDSEFIERELTYKDEIISDHINYEGKLYAVTTPGLNLIAFDFSDPDLHHEHVISGEPIILLTVCERKVYLVESCEDILLICIGSYSYEVSDVQIFKADLSNREWVKLKTLGDRTIFLGSRNNNFSSPATTTLGMKGNAIYWVSTPFGSPSKRQLYMYDIKGKSISLSLLFPIIGTSLSWWESFPMTCNSEDKRSEQKDRVSLVIRNFSHAQKGEATIKSTRELQIEQRKIQKKTEEKVTIGSTTIVRKESLWSDLPKDLLLEIFPYLFAGDTVAFRSVCRSWHSVSPPHPSKTTQQFVLPLNSLDFSAPLLMCPYNKAYSPIHRELYSIDFPDIPGAKVRATRDGWLLMDYYSTELYFYDPFTKEEISLPSFGARFYFSVFFSAPPTSADCLVVVAAKTLDNTDVICFKKFEDEGWTCYKISAFCFSDCNPVVYKGLYYFLGTHVGELLIFDPDKDIVRKIGAPELKSEFEAHCEQQYMLESDDGKLLAVFVGPAGRFVYTCEWNLSTSKWEILGSLGNIMLFVSRPLSLCQSATVRGTGNKIYFPRVVCDGQILFYSLATRRYHTFDMGISYSYFSASSKFYPEYNSWFMP